MKFSKLIRLELAKNNIKPYITASGIITFIGLLLCFLFAFIPQLEANEGIPSTTDVLMFNNWNMLTTLTCMIFAISFAVLSAVMHTRFTIDEYVGKRTVLLFSYPYSKSKVLSAKCSLVFVFTAVVMFISTLVTIAIFGLVSNAFGIMPEQLSPSMIPDVLSIIGVCSLLAASSGMVAMRIGFWRRSLVATVVTSVVLIAPFSNIISMFPQYSGVVHLVGMVVMVVIAVVIFIELLSKVNKMEAV